MLMRVFLGWLRGERGHCGMVAIPTLEEEDAKRPSRERENLVGERTRIINRVKAALARLGIRGFKPELCKASERLETLRTPEELPIPANMLDEIRRDLARLSVAREQIGAIERARLARLERAPASPRDGEFARDVLVRQALRHLIRRTASSLKVNLHAKAGGIGLMATTGNREPTQMKGVSLASAIRSAHSTPGGRFQSDLP